MGAADDFTRRYGGGDAGTSPADDFTRRYGGESEGLSAPALDRGPIDDLYQQYIADKPESRWGSPPGTPGSSNDALNRILAGDDPLTGQPVKPPVSEVLGLALPLVASMYGPEMAPVARGLVNVGTAAFGGGLGGWLTKEDPYWEAAKNAFGAGAGEIVSGAGRVALRSSVAQNWVNDWLAKNFLRTVGEGNPAITQAYQGQVISDAVRHGQDIAKLRQAATEGVLDKTAGLRYGNQVAQINQSSGEPVIDLTGRVKQGYEAIPELGRDVAIGPPGQRLASPLEPAPGLADIESRQQFQGVPGQPWVRTVDPVKVGPDYLTFEQAAKLRSYLADKAFRDYTKTAGGLTQDVMEDIWSTLTDRMEQQLLPRDLIAWRQARQQEGLAMALNEFMRRPDAVAGDATGMTFNRNAFSRWLAQNPDRNVQRMGQENFDRLVQGGISGAQPGMQDVVRGGGGRGINNALMSYLFGSSTGVPGAGAAAAMVLPKVLPTSKYMGGPFLGPPWYQAMSGSNKGMQVLLDMLGIAGAQQALPSENVKVW